MKICMKRYVVLQDKAEKLHGCGKGNSAKHT